MLLLRQNSRNFCILRKKNTLRPLTETVKKGIMFLT